MRSKWKGAYCSPEVKEMLLSKDAIELSRDRKKTINSPEGQLPSKASAVLGERISAEREGEKRPSLRGAILSTGQGSRPGAERGRVVYIWSRGSTILPEFIGKTVNIHNGKEFKNLEIKNEHIGFKFGELAVTKKSPKYKIKSRHSGKK